MIIEQNTNYAYKMKYMDNPTFDKVRDLSAKFYRELPQALQDELYDALHRGIDILDSEPQMTAYMFSFGKMHQAKLEYAFGKLPEEFFEQPEINIIDYGCGQAIGTMCYMDYLCDNGYAQQVKSITLIEPSELSLKRAALHASVFFPDAEIKTVNKTFDELDEDDIHCDEDIPTLHILSNVLDILDIDLADFTELIKKHLTGYNQFVCVGPYFNYPDKDERIDDFRSLLDGEENYCEIFDKYELDPEKAWTAQILCFSTGELLSTEVTEEEIEEGIEDELGVVYSKNGNRLLKCNNPKLEIYSIKKGTKIICDRAFSIFDDETPVSISSLKIIKIPDSVIAIGAEAFVACEFLQQIRIPDSIKSIQPAAFSGCLSLQNVTIPNSVTYIMEGAFFGCLSLKQITIPDSVERIGDGVFMGCESLQQITIPNSISHIGSHVFRGCKSLNEISLPNQIHAIGEKAFYECKSLKEIVIPKSVISIGNAAFKAVPLCNKSYSPTRLKALETKLLGIVLLCNK